MAAAAAEKTLFQVLVEKVCQPLLRTVGSDLVSLN
jgi:hypothetical protein